MNRTKEKIVVGMSGGVDSSVSAKILKDKGLDVFGVYFKFEKGPDRSDEEDVRILCASLGIPLEIVDISRQFKKEVVHYFLREYLSGRTPNPCVICNEKVKFSELFKAAKKLGAEYVATGHYAKVKSQKSKVGKSNQNVKVVYNLFQAKDKSKDQSYFLYRLKQKQLAKIIFPLGEMNKSEVKKLAKKWKLPVADKKESQDVCFLKNTSVQEFLRANLSFKKGIITDTKGQVIGGHQGLPLYTIGQRKGINIGGTGPYWVLRKDNRRNILIVTNDKKELGLGGKKIAVGDVNWIRETPDRPLEMLVQTRYQSPKVYATIKPRIVANGNANDREYLVDFDKAPRAVASGQSAVFYTKEGEVVGGGIIK